MIDKTDILFNRSYYDTSGFYNNYLSTILCASAYLESAFFPDDPQRIIYSTNDHAFRRRLKLQGKNDPEVSKFQLNTLNMPFMNFAISQGGISGNTNRVLKSGPLEKFGVMDWVSGKKIRATPLHMEFEATYFSTEEIDIQYVMSLLQWDEALESLLKPEIQIGENVYQNFASLEFSSIDYNPMYNENDWLEQNKIRTVSLPFTIDTYLISTDDSKFWIPKNILFSFAKTHDLAIHDWEDYDVLLNGVIDHINEKVEF